MSCVGTSKHLTFTSVVCTSQMSSPATSVSSKCCDSTPISVSRSYALPNDQNTLIEQNKKLYAEIDHHKKEIAKLKKLVNTERNKKRKFAQVLYEFGLSNSYIRSLNADFRYSVEIRKYKLFHNNITKLQNNIELYCIGIYYGRKSFEFTNSSNIALERKDLKVINVDNENEHVNFRIQKIGKSFGCIYDNDSNYNNNSSTSNTLRSSNNYDSCRWDIIEPDDHFLVIFEHPIVQKVGIYTLKYRLFSFNKANTKKCNGNGAFGPKMEFQYEVQWEEYY